jgi:Sec-independent protein secretion pathway component TatC
MPREPNDQPESPEGAVMSFGDHLDELRRRLLYALAAPVPIAVVVFLLADRIRWLLVDPLQSALRASGQSDALQSLSVTEMMLLDIKLSIIAAIVLSAPWILWQIWKFVEPGLYRHERRFARLLVPASFVLVLAGVATLYFILLPLMLSVLVNYGLEPRGGPPPVFRADAEGFFLPLVDETPKEAAPGQAWIKMPERMLTVAMPAGAANADGSVALELYGVPLTRDSAYIQQYRVSEYVDLVLLLLAGIALVFQLPLAILLLGWMGIVRVEVLRAHRKHAIFALTIVAAIITPTSDVFSLLLMLLPLYLLYELGILLLKAAPPSAVAEGDVFRGFVRRLKAAASGKRSGRPAQPAQSAVPASSAGAAGASDDRSADDRRDGEGFR